MKRWSYVLVAVALAAVSCGGDGGEGANGETDTEAPQSQTTDSPNGTADPAAEEPEEVPDEVEDLGEATLMLGGAVITWAPAWVAVCEGFFQDHGLEVEIIASEGGTTPAIAALVSRDVLATGSGTAAGVGPIREGAPIQMGFVAAEGYVVQFTVSNEWLEQSGVSVDDPLEDRIRALQGATVAINNPGGAHEALLRYVLPQYDLDPDTDITMTALGDFPPMVAALGQGSIDAFGASPPWGSQAYAEGVGEILFSGNEVEGLDDIPFLIGSVHTQEIEEEPERIIALLRGLADAMDFLRSDPDGGYDCIRDVFPDLNQTAFDSAYDFAMTTIPDSPVVTEERWNSLAAFSESTGDPLNVTYEEAVAIDIMNEALSNR